MTSGLLPHQLDGVRAFLVAAGEDVEGELHCRLIAGGRSNLTYRLDDGKSAWVLRRPPSGGLTPSAHDVAREFRVNRALQGTGVPVARTVGLSADLDVLGAPFSVVDYVEGRIIRSSADLERWNDEDVASCVSALVDALAALHAVDFREVGLAGFGRTDGYGERQLRRWSRQWAHMEAQSPLADRLQALLADILPAQRTCTVVHGDYRVDNTILGSDDIARVLAIVDWELSTLGDPVADVAMMCAYRHPGLDAVLGTDAAWTSDRMPSADELAGLYELRAGSSLTHWEFYLALAFYKLAVIAEGIDFRYRLGATSGSGFATAGDAVPQFLEAGLEVAAGA